MEQATPKQIDFATVIAETIGADLPAEDTKEAYQEFISENLDEFYELQNEERRNHYRNDEFWGYREPYHL